MTEAALLSRWEERGLVVQDSERCMRYLRHIGYYRLSPYVRSFEASRDVLREGTTFDEILNLYIFDRRLTLLVMDAIERFEVATRAAIGDHMCRLGGPHWYEAASHFRHPNRHARLLNDVDNLVDNQLARVPERPADSSFFVSALEHYVTQYGDPKRPPSWLVLEELSLGALRSVYDNLSRRSDKTAIARTIGLTEPMLTSWLRSYQRVRNICAHHGRLWNRGLGVNPAIPSSLNVRWLDDRELFERDRWRRQRLYPVLVSLQTVLHTVSPGSTWSARLRDLLDEHPHVSRVGTGIPEDWWTDGFWPVKESGALQTRLHSRMEGPRHDDS
ncbi:Abi family protein [Luteipulveratus sp. YIM 133132]|uniref:Abi family protein n=1 Tax=Luteipulveratus flavus TaxID=3031728 RepID=UPI0023B0055A|nr:Abi family protein [Luteipulveratus sp. YIM 133132]MDE9365685.1 Abi family protein [Luteipulveratus sp. YIM 133132]